MYPVSAAYKTAIGQNVRDVKIAGTITLKDDTIINITDEDIVQGSLYVTEQCVAGEDIEVGNVYASEMGLSLSMPLENPYSLDGARIIINFGINVETDPDEPPIWEYVPLGYFYVTEIQRKANNVNLTALDGMLLFDVEVGDPGSSSPRNFIVHACQRAGVTLGTSVFEIDTFANATLLFAAPDASKIKTCRDLLMWACQIMGAFARMNRQGELEIVPIKARPSVKTINKAERFNSDVSDFAIQITKVSMQVGEAEYSRGTEGMTMVLDENPLMTGLSESQINTVLDNLLAQITTAVYVPFNSNFIGDPALQPGDFVTLSDTSVLGGGDVASIITHSTWRYRGPHNIKGAGKHGLVRGVQNQQMKAVSSIVAIARAAQDLALAANQSTQLIKDAIGGHVLIRREPGGTNEILIMDHPDPEQAVKIWRWNMGGLGYSDNVVGADNPDREYEIAMTMDGAINANFIKTGSLDAGVVTIGPETTFAPGYDPSQIEGASAVGMGVDDNCVGLWHFDGSLNSHKGVAAIGDENFDTGCFGQAVKVEEGTTNILDYDSSFIVWGSDGSNMATLTTKLGKYSFKVQGTSTVPGAYAYVYPNFTTSNVNHSLSCKVKNNNSKSLIVKVLIRDGNNGTSISENKQYVISAGQTEFLQVSTTTPVTSSRVTFTVSIFSDSSDGTVNAEVFEVQGEAKDHSTPFVDGTRLGVLKAPTTGLSASQGTISFRAKNLAESANDTVLVDLPKSDNTQGILAGISSATGHEGELCITDLEKVSKSYTETTQADFQSGTLADVTASSTGNLELNFQYVDISTTGGAISGGDFSTNTKDKAFNNNDSDLVNAWYSAQGGAAISGVAFIGQNFGSAKTIKRIRIKQHNSAAYAISSVKLQRSSDGVNWTDVQIIDLNIDGNWQTIDIVANLSAQYWRLLANANTTYSFWVVYEIEMMEMQYKTSGTREKIVDLSGANPAGGTKIEWASTTPTGTSVTVETALSTDGGNTYGAYAEATSGNGIPGIASDTDLSNAKLKIKETLSTTDTSVTPQLHSLSFTIWEKQASTVYGPNKSTLTAWDSISLAWKPERLSLVVNDEEACYIENPGLPAALGSHVFIGTDRNGANAINTLVDELRIDKVYREVNIRTGWHKTGVPFYTSEDMKQWPGYVKAETDGLKVYDSLGNLRVHVGSWVIDLIRQYGIRIIDGLIEASKIYGSSFQSGQKGATSYVRIGAGFEPLEIYENGKKALNIWSANGGMIQFYSTLLDNMMGQISSFDDAAGTGLKIHARNNAGSDRKLLLVGNDISFDASGHTAVESDLWVSGSVYKTGQLHYVEPTKDYGVRLLNALESPELKYVDMGRAQLENGEATVYLDPILLQCIEPDTDLTPWLFKTEVYGEGEDIRVIEWGENYFKVKECNGGTSNRKFGWWFYATRINYAGIRLQEYVEGVV